MPDLQLQVNQVLQGQVDISGIDEEESQYIRGLLMQELTTDEAVIA
jgi:hypothetical protein